MSVHDYSPLLYVNVFYRASALIKNNSVWWVCLKQKNMSSVYHKNNLTEGTNISTHNLKQQCQSLMFDSLKKISAPSLKEWSAALLLLSISTLGHFNIYQLRVSIPFTLRNINMSIGHRHIDNDIFGICQVLNEITNSNMIIFYHTWERIYP